MSRMDIIKTALLNLKAGKRSSIKIIFGLSIAIMLSICIFSVKESFDIYVEEFNEKHIKECYYYMNYDNKMSEETLNNIRNTATNFLETHNGKEVLTLLDLQCIDMNIPMEYGKTSLVIDENNIYNLSKITTSLQYPYKDVNYALKEVSYGLYIPGINVYRSNMKNGALITGAYPEKSGEIVLDNYFLELYGLKEPEKLIGKKISIVVSNDGVEKEIFKDYVLSGILDVKAIDKRETYSFFDCHLEHIFVNPMPEDYERFNVVGNIRNYFDCYTEYVEEYSEIENLLRLKLAEVCDNNDVLLTVKGLEFCILYWVMEHIGLLILVILIVVIFILIMSILYVLKFYKDRNLKYYSMLFSIGMNKNDRKRIYSVEMSVVFWLSALIGTYAAIVFLLLFGTITSLTLDFGFVFSIGALIAGIFAVWILFKICSNIVLKI